MSAVLPCKSDYLPQFSATIGRNRARRKWFLRGAVCGWLAGVGDPRRTAHCRAEQAALAATGRSVQYERNHSRL